MYRPTPDAATPGYGARCHLLWSVFKYSFDFIHFFFPKINNGEMNSPILLDAHLPGKKKKNTCVSGPVCTFIVRHKPMFPFHLPSSFGHSIFIYLIRKTNIFKYSNMINKISEVRYVRVSLPLDCIGSLWASSCPGTGSRTSLGCKTLVLCYRREI